MRGDVDAVAAEADDGLLQVVQHTYYPGDTDPDGVLEVMDYRQGGHHRRQVGLDRVTAMMEEEAKPARPEEPLDRPHRLDGDNDPSWHHCLHQTGEVQARTIG